jgi:hypothetical protein
MKKLIAFSSVLALVLVGSGLFAIDILDKDGVATGFSVGMEARYGFNMDTPAPDAGTAYDPEPTTLYEQFDDRQARVSIGVSYNGDLYAFGVGAQFNKRWTDTELSYGVDTAWGKFYFMDKQLWLRAGSLDGVWRIDTDPISLNYADTKGLQLNFAPSSVNGLQVGVALPVPLNGATRTIVSATAGTAAKDAYWEFKDSDSDNKVSVGDEVTYHEAVKAVAGTSAVTAKWGPSYPFANMRFGLRLNGTIPNLDFGTELKLNGLAETNGKVDPVTHKPLEDEAEGDFKGMDFHFLAVYTFAPITIKAALAAENIADGRASGIAKDTLVRAGVRVIFDIPNSIPNLDLGDPWVQLMMQPTDITSGDDKNGRNAGRPADEQLKQESFQDMHINFEWEPSYSIVPDKVKGSLLFGLYYSSWVKPTDLEKEYPIEVAVQPKVTFSFAPNATISIFDRVTLAQKAVKEGFKNALSLRIALGF